MNISLPLFEEAEMAPSTSTTPAYVYRARILKLRSAEQRRAALEAISDSTTRGTVKFYIADYFARLHHRPLPCLACIEAGEGITRRQPCRHKPP